MSQFEIRRTPDGRLQARRRDGMPMSPEDREEVKLLALAEEAPLRAWVVEEVKQGDSLQAVLICSSILDDHLWVVLDRAFTPRGGLACYYADEIRYLKGKTAEDLKAIHLAKLKFPGCRIIQ